MAEGQIWEEKVLVWYNREFETNEFDLEDSNCEIEFCC